MLAYELPHAVTRSIESSRAYCDNRFGDYHRNVGEIYVEISRDYFDVFGIDFLRDSANSSRRVKVILDALIASKENELHEFEKREYLLEEALEADQEWKRALGTALVVLNSLQKFRIISFGDARLRFSESLFNTWFGSLHGDEDDQFHVTGWYSLDILVETGYIEEIARDSRLGRIFNII